MKAKKSSYRRHDSSLRKCGKQKQSPRKYTVLKYFQGGCLGHLFHSVTSIFDWSDNLVANFEIKLKSFSILFLSVRLTLVFEKGEIALKLFATLLAISAILASIKRWIFTWSYRSSIYTKCTGPI